MNLRNLSWIPVLLLAVLYPAAAQNFSGDARKIGMGGIGYSENIATRMIEDERPYGSIVLPIGLIQLLRDRHHFDPDDDRFDPVLAMEYAANPIHYVVGRDPGGPRGRLVEDIVNGELNRDLNTYRGFKPTDHLTAEGLASPSFGKTFKVYRRDDGTFHGFYVGAGPYLSARTVLNIDKALIDVLASSTPVSIPNRSFFITDESVGQIALAVTGGYRGHFALPGRPGRDGVYVGGNYHYLRGFHYDEAAINLRFDTDEDGLLLVRPTTVPGLVDYRYSRSGTGYAIDLGVAGVIDRLEIGFGANGVGNRIDWKEFSLRRYTLQSLVEGGDFITQKFPGPSGKVRMELPVDYTGSGAYHWESISAVAEVARGFQGTRFHSGLEFRLGSIDLRGGGGYSLDRWHPSGGIGLNLSERVSLDIAAFGSTTNIERELRPAIAVSLRINRLP